MTARDAMAGIQGAPLGTPQHSRWRKGKKNAADQGGRRRGLNHLSPQVRNRGRKTSRATTE